MNNPSSLQSPDYTTASEYPPNKNCGYRIDTPAQEADFSIDFHTFDLEYSLRCFDKVHLYKRGNDDLQWSRVCYFYKFHFLKILYFKKFIKICCKVLQKKKKKKKKKTCSLRLPKTTVRLNKLINIQAFRSLTLGPFSYRKIIKETTF